MADSNFYLGRAYDPIRQTITEKEIRYDPADLTTHAVVTGMTGSGKTGLCVVLLEEAALQGIPAIIIDPKGDLTNLLLHFPDLAPQDFQPWIDADLARRAGKAVEQVAADASLSWREGLKEWGIPQERILALKNAAQFAIFTPGSDAGIPVSVLSSLAAPEIPWNENREILREKITSTVTALLGLVGFLVKSFHVEGFWSAFFGALVISLITLVLNSFTQTGDAQLRVHRAKQKPRPPDSDGGGPVIDV